MAGFTRSVDGSYHSRIILASFSVGQSAKFVTDRFFRFVSQFSAFEAALISFVRFDSFLKFFFFGINLKRSAKQNRASVFSNFKAF